jgi:hypothetical protein
MVIDANVKCNYQASLFPGTQFVVGSGPAGKGVVGVGYGIS